MANQIRIKRRASTGAAGAPASLLNAELAYNEADNVLYYGFGDNGSGVATSVVAIAGAGNSVTIGTNQVITGDKEFSGTLNASGTFQLSGEAVTASAAEINHLVGVTSGIQGQLDDASEEREDTRTLIGATGELSFTELGDFDGTTIQSTSVKGALQDLETALEGANSDAVDLRTLSGTADGDVSYGAASGRGFEIIGDDATTLSALQSLDAAGHELGLNQADLILLSGVDENAQSLGEFAGVTIASNRTIKQALQDLETSVESKGSSGSMDSLALAVGDLNTLTGVAQNETDLGEFTGSTISDDATIKGALQELETKLDSTTTVANNNATTVADHETRITANEANIASIDGLNTVQSSRLANLTQAVGVAVDDTDLGTFTGETISDNSTVKGALQELETKLEDGSGKIVTDNGTEAEYSSGQITVSGDNGLATSANANEVVISLQDTTVTAAAYGSASAVPSFTVDSTGRLSAAADVTIDITHDQVSDFDAGVQANTLDSLAQPVGDVAINNQRLTGLADPVGDQDAVTKRYADALVTGLDVKRSVRAATVADITLSDTQTVDGVVLEAGDRVLVKDQADKTANGIYDVVAGGAWTRSGDADNTPNGEVTSGMYVFVEEGSTNADAGFVLQNTGDIELGTTELDFVQFTGAGQVTAGAGLSKTGNTLDVGTADAGRIVVNANDIDLATIGTSGTYNGLEVDAYGRVASFTQPTTLAGYSITDAQALDAGLTSIAGLTTAADQMLYTTGEDTYATTSLSVFSRSLLDDADAATARGTLGLGSIATQDASAVAITGGTIDNVVIDGGVF